MEVPVPCNAAPETTDKYKRILKDNGVIEEVSEVLLDGNENQSPHTHVTIKFADPSVKPLHLFVKSQKATEAHKAMKLFEKESIFFTQYVPALKEFCQSHRVDGLVDIYPKCYYGDEEILVFENLVTNRGYILLDKNDQLDLESSRLAMITLAKHHALSHAFIKHVGESEPFFQRFPNLNYEPFEVDMLEQFYSGLIETGISTNIKLIEKSKVSDKDEAISILQAHIGKGYQAVFNALKYHPENEKLLTLNHGDYWNNNMMFMRDEKTNELCSHVTFDLEMTRYNSPALDIGYFMYTSVKPEVRREHLKELLKLYLDMFIDTTGKLGSPIQLSFDEFFHLYRRKFQFGFWFAIWMAVDVAATLFGKAQQNDGDGDAESSTVKYDRLLDEWINENPEKCMENAKALIELMKEYSELAL